MQRLEQFVAEQRIAVGRAELPSFSSGDSVMGKAAKSMAVATFFATVSLAAWFRLQLNC